MLVVAVASLLVPITFTIFLFLWYVSRCLWLMYAF